MGLMMVSSELLFLQPWSSNELWSPEWIWLKIFLSLLILISLSRFPLYLSGRFCISCSVGCISGVMCVNNSGYPLTVCVCDIDRVVPFFTMYYVYVYKWKLSSLSVWVESHRPTSLLLSWCVCILSSSPSLVRINVYIYWWVPMFIWKKNVT